MLFTVLRGLLALLVMLSLCFFGNQFDDELNLEATRLVQQLQVATPEYSNAFIYHTGIFAPTHLDPETVGREALETTKNYTINLSYLDDKYPQSDRLSIPRGKLFCSIFKEDDCIRRLFTHHENIETLKQENAVLLLRNRKFHSYKNYKTLTRSGYWDSLPQYTYFIKAERILMLDAIQRYRSGEIIHSLELLYSQLSRLRLAFQRQDQLLGKMIFLGGMNQVIDITSIILTETGEKANKVYPLSKTERDLNQVAASEFGLAYNTYTTLDKNPEFFRMGANTPGWIVRSVFKPNMTMNAVAPIYTRLERLSTLSLSQFAMEFSNTPAQELTTSYFRNPVGSMLSSVTADMDEYVARIMDFNVKIQLFNHRYHEDQDFSTSKNPYFFDETALVYNHKVCHRGLSGNDHIRCLQTSLEPEHVANNAEQ